ncbi:hypothetical protein MASR2M70_03410 [Bacillota bacterium]
MSIITITKYAIVANTIAKADLRLSLPLVNIYIKLGTAKKAISSINPELEVKAK